MFPPFLHTSHASPAKPRVLVPGSHLKPGAYAEFLDTDLRWQSPDGSLKDTMADKVNQKFLGACDAAGLEPSPGKHLERWLRDAGFEDVHVEQLIMPVGTWPADKRLVSSLELSFSRFGPCSWPSAL